MAEIRVGNVFVCAAEDGCGVEVEVKKVRGSVDESVLMCCGRPMELKEFSGWSVNSLDDEREGNAKEQRSLTPACSCPRDPATSQGGEE